jgi:hypothetical protein
MRKAGKPAERPNPVMGIADLGPFGPVSRGTDLPVLGWVQHARQPAGEGGSTAW